MVYLSYKLVVRLNNFLNSESKNVFYLFSGRMGMFRFEYFLLSPHLESGGPQRGPVELIFLSVSLSGHLRRFLVTIKAWPINKRIACGRRPQVLQYILCRSTLSLYWVQKVPSVFQYILYVCHSVSLSGCTRRFLAIIRAARNYT